MVVGVLTPCLIALYMIVIIVAYHTICKKHDCHDQSVSSQYSEVI